MTHQCSVTIPSELAGYSDRNPASSPIHHPVGAFVPDQENRMNDQQDNICIHIPKSSQINTTFLCTYIAYMDNRYKFKKPKEVGHKL